MTTKIPITIVTILLVILQSCREGRVENNVTSIDSVAGNDDVLQYLKSFKGRGELTNDSLQPTSPSKTLAAFRYPNDLKMDLVLSEPAIVQPVEISFDHRGRLWVVQYNQYPYPKGVKITSVDNFLRVTFDKLPAAPPEGVKGADKISFFEDTNGDGTYDKSTDAITGLNIATSVAVGRGRIWVLNPPYLLAYPDADDNGLPDGPPVVHLAGFGLQDTHAVANSLTWGPDGWLYGAQGSTTTSTISSSVTKNIFLEGQAIWRYHPASHVFERFAEGGGNNPFNLEMDEKGRIYSGSNGTDRGPVYKQGGYYIKSWGKHGPLSNPYAFGYLPNMAYDGEKKRFTHAFIKYEGGSLPARYNGKMMALNPYLNFIQLGTFEPVGSSFKNVDEERILQTTDKWFRPVDIQAGPDGAVYLADWYDSRLSHVDPRDTWDKGSGRIYRMRNKDSSAAFRAINVGACSNNELLNLLASKNRWLRRQALLVIGNRKDSKMMPALLQLLRSGNSQASLEALWAINLGGGFNDTVAMEALHHQDPYVRMWAIRLLGDANEVSTLVGGQLAQLATHELHAEVASQLASTARRLPGEAAVPIIRNLLESQHHMDDPDVPQLIWWAVESKAETDRKAILALFDNRRLWANQIVQEVILKNLMQRYIMAGGTENFNAAAHLLKHSPAPHMSKLLISGLREGLHGKSVTELPRDLVKELKPFRATFEEAPLALGLRQGQQQAEAEALAIIADNTALMAHRLIYIRIMGEIDKPKAVPVLLKVLESNLREFTPTASELRRSILESLQRYDTPDIATRVLKAYPTFRADIYDRLAALQLLATRPGWAKKLIDEILVTKQISKEDVPENIAHSLKSLDDAVINKTVDGLWPATRLLSSAEKTTAISKASKSLNAGTGDPARGRVLFLGTCGGCHRLNGEGGAVGPDLSAYNRNDVGTMLTNIIDPNADIREGYEMQRIRTVDGRTLEGRITARNGGSVTFSPRSGGKDITLAAAQVKDIQPGNTSLMPERLLDKMSEQETRDFFSYLRK